MGIAVLHRVAAMVAGAVLAAGVLAVLPQTAALAYQTIGHWAPGTHARTTAGNVVAAEWRLTVRGEKLAASGPPVGNVTVTLTADHAVFTGIRDLCLTSGVDPASAIP